MSLPMDVNMARTKVFLSACLIIGVKADVTPQKNEECVSPQWKTAAIGLAAILAILGIVTVFRILLPRLLRSSHVRAVDDEPQISKIECGIAHSDQNGKANISTITQDNFAFAQNESKQHTLNAAFADAGRNVLYPAISVQPPSECNTPTTAGITDWVPSPPPPPPPGMLLWVPSKAKRRSVSLRGESEDDRSVCSTCSDQSQSHTPNGSPPGSPVGYSGERKRSVTFNQSVEEIHVLSSVNEPKRQNRSRSPSLVIAGAFYVR